MSVSETLSERLGAVLILSCPGALSVVEVVVAAVVVVTGCCSWQ